MTRHSGPLRLLCPHPAFSVLLIPLDLLFYVSFSAHCRVVGEGVEAFILDFSEQVMGSHSRKQRWGAEEQRSLIHTPALDPLWNLRSITAFRNLGTPALLSYGPCFWRPRHPHAHCSVLVASGQWLFERVGLTVHRGEQATLSRLSGPGFTVLF